MKLQHYLGGLEGLDPIPLETRVFVESWEERIFGIHTAMMALSPQLSTYPNVPTTFSTVWTWADLRKGAEAMNPFDYFKYRYYEKWLGGISGYFVDKGYITQSELDERTNKFLLDPTAPLPNGGNATIDDRVRQYLLIGDDPLRNRTAEPRFAVGDAVVVGDPETVDHTRLPGHLRNKVGVIDLVYPDAYAYLCSTGTDGLGEPMAVYCVRFDPEDLWPNNTEDNFTFYADIFEAYLEVPPISS